MATQSGHGTRWQCAAGQAQERTAQHDDEPSSCATSTPLRTPRETACPSEAHAAHHGQPCTSPGTGRAIPGTNLAGPGTGRAVIGAKPQRGHSALNPAARVRAGSDWSPSADGCAPTPSAHAQPGAPNAVLTHPKEALT